MNDDNVIPVVECTRGPIVESIHRGAMVAVDISGEVVASLGDLRMVTYLRSTAKPFQALPFYEMGGAERFSITEEEIAITCASHSGTDEHVRVVSGLQRKIGVNESDLLCGSHQPYHDATARELIQKGENPTPNRHNCSGKHTGMLGQAKLRNLPTEEYIDIHHPVQQAILQAFSEVCSISPSEVVVGIDGCSAPNFAIPLFNAALGFARLADPRGMTGRRSDALQRIFHAMGAHPNMVAGPDRFDTALMQLTGGKIVAKAGAEGYQGIALAPGLLSKSSPGIGIAFKIADGDVGGRARPVMAVEILKQLGVLSTSQSESLIRYSAHPLTNWRKVVVGEIRPCFKLNQ